MKNNKIRIETVYKENNVFNEYELMKELKANNIVKERVELYRDFTVNLICYVHTTYFGKDFLKKEEDIIGHFNWAFEKVIKEFEIEGIRFNDTKELYIYFQDYFLHQFYNFESVPPIKDYIVFWDDIFSLHPKKQKNIMKVLTDLYLTFDTALDNKKTLVEI
jgi:hypothetical protein